MARQEGAGGLAGVPDTGGPYFVRAEDLQGVAGRQLQLNQFLILCFNHL